MGWVAPRHVESSQTRDWTCVPHTGRWILNHWATKEVPDYILKRKVCRKARIFVGKWERQDSLLSPSLGQWLGLWLGATSGVIIFFLSLLHIIIIENSCSVWDSDNNKCYYHFLKWKRVGKNLAGDKETLHLQVIWQPKGIEIVTG